MKKVLGGGLALAFTAAGTMLLAGPGATQEDLRLASLSPTEVVEGGTVTVTGEPCEKGTAVWAVFLESDEVGGESFLDGSTDATNGLSFSFVFPVGEATPANYLVQISCGPFPEDPFDPNADLYSTADGNTDLFFTVVAAPTAPTTEAPPAPPVRDDPDFTG